MKNKRKKWEQPKLVRLNLSETKGGRSNHSEGRVDKWGNPKPGRIPLAS